LAGLQPCGVQGGDLRLFVSGDDARLIRHDPHLHELRRVTVLLAGEAPGVVLLRVQDAGAGGIR
jgi:hypothetical protein